MPANERMLAALRAENALMVGEGDRNKSWSSAENRAVERVKGIEPSYSAWKAAALPLSYTRPRLVVGEVGLEPTKA